MNRTAEQLKAKQFFEGVIKTGDLRYLLRLGSFDKLPEYDINYLYDAWDKVAEEYEQLTDNHSITKNLQATNEINIKNNRMLGLQAAYYLMPLVPKKAIESLEYFGIHVKDCKPSSCKYVLQMIRSEDTKMRIAAIRKRNRQEIKKEITGDNGFYDIITFIESEVKIVINEDEISLKKLCVTLNNINRKRKHGRAA